ncbi:MAG: phospho-N-acetylmuramoyl-pentapeptide-transferase [Vicinamibacteria bacterium]|nr:phospho-N-acetylmuramoyl-pentapeptide-transferase [Vicinamibacteria bacterium]
MLFHLLYAFRHEFSLLNVTRYITFRTAVASLTAFLLVLILGPWVIARLRSSQIGQYIREDGPEAHRSKAGTPTMGGLLILAGILIPTMLWSDLTNRKVWLLLFATSAFGAVGFADDYLKVVKRRNLGLTIRRKLLAQIVIGLVLGVMIYLLAGQDPARYSTHVIFPFFKNFVPDLGLFYILFAVLVVVGASDAVNFTDGLDGLAIGSMLIAAVAFTGLAYLSGHAVFSNYLDLLFIPGSGEVTVFCGAMVGSSMGFLWWNCYPARVFMGDVGSLSLGGALGTVALLIKQELLLVSVGGLFVLEALSVILQISSFKLTGKRIFRMAPLHHHFELVGWKEPQVIIRFWILASIFALLSLTTLKLR